MSLPGFVHSSSRGRSLKQMCRSVTVVLAASMATLLVPAHFAPAHAATGAATVQAMAVSPTSMSLAAGNSANAAVTNASGSVTLQNSDASVISASYASGTIKVTGVKAGNAVLTVKDSKSSKTITVAVSAAPVAAATVTKYALMAWNDLGMHCVDGKDYSVFSILPPYNNLHAQLVNVTTGKVVTSGVSLTYQALMDPDGSINSLSSTKTNFWQYVRTLFGVNAPADVGLTGNPTPGYSPAAMKWNSTQSWFEAEGLPITPYDDRNQKNFYPMVKVVARDGKGTVLATAQAVLPVSDEMTCKACHSSNAAGNAAQTAAKPPISGWANDADAERDWKKNILRLHDDKKLGKVAAYAKAITQLGYDSRGLAATAAAGRPVLCASCHASNALPGTGVAGISALTAALHTRHSTVIDPTQGVALDAIGNRSSCYMCHPGSVTKCLRGAMGNATDASGNAEMGCQSCHGNMKAVGNPARVGWLAQPNCQACHHDGKRELSAVDATGKLKTPTDTRFATNPNKPAAGYSLYRFSQGHGKLQCEACHGATHAEYPSSHLNDNLQSIDLQGHAGTVSECAACHASVPLTSNGGPHGMHTVGSNWVGKHGDYAEGSGKSACAACHGADYRGSPLSQAKAARKFNVEGKSVSYSAGQAVGCYDCHNGPSGEGGLAANVSGAAPAGASLIHGLLVSRPAASQMDVSPLIAEHLNPLAGVFSQVKLLASR